METERKPLRPGRRGTTGAIAVVVAALVALATTARATEVFIDITRKKSEHIRMAVPPFTHKAGALRSPGDESLGATAKDVLEFDILFSGYFSVLKDFDTIKEISAKESQSKKVEWKQWGDAGISTLIEGNYYAIPGDEMAVECRLSDVERQEQLAGIRYTGTRTVFRKMLHKFADQVVYRFTGEPGIADSRIVFSSKTARGKELFVADYDGQNVKQLTEFNSIIISPRWSPFGTQVLFTSFHRRQPNSYLLDLRSGSVKPILKNVGNHHSAASWSPDGKLFAFSMATNGISDIYTITTDGQDLKRLTNSDSIETSPVFSPDGTQIAFVSDRAGKPQIYLMNADGSAQHRFTFTGDYNADPAWSPKGDKIAYASMVDWTFNIMVKSLDGSIEKQLTANAGKNESPSWSPDGRHIAFSSTRTGEKQVYIMNANGENQLQVTNMPSGAYGPNWSPRN